MLKLFLGYDYFIALMIEDAGVPPPSGFPPKGIEAIRITWTWGF